MPPTGQVENCKFVGNMALMADYYPIVVEAVRSLADNNAENRRALYDRVRATLTENLQQARTSERDLHVHRSGLEQAIIWVEQEEMEREAQAAGGLRHQLGVFSFLLGREKPITSNNRTDQTVERPVAQAEERTAERPAIRPTEIVVGHDSKVPEPTTSPGTSAFIFVCYRRDEFAGFAGRIFDRLISNFSRERIFMDVDNIEPGLDFVEVLEERVSVCPVFLALVGPNWSNAKDARGRRRLDDERDFVRIEIESALRRKVRVIPILIVAAQMPDQDELPDSLKPLTRRQAFEISHVSFDRDVEALVRVLKRIDNP